MKNNTDIPIENSLVPWLGKTMKLIDNSIEDILAENNINLSKVQFVILKNIEHNEGICQSELAFFSNRNKSSLTRMIATLERKEYIVKNHCKEDKRRCELKISSKGKQILSEAAPFLKKFVKKMEEGVSEDEKLQLKNLLIKIQNNIIGEGPSPFFKEKK